MARVLIIGGGPAGYSAALFTAKYGLETTIYDTNETRMHRAFLYNYLGIEGIHGSDFIKIARRQAEKFGAAVKDDKVISVEKAGDQFRVKTESGKTDSGKYLLISTGVDSELLTQLGVELEGKDVKVDRHCQTSIENLYAPGWTSRSQVQAIISAGDGATAAIHLIAKEAGKPYRDFDVPPGAES
ncbi:FAD-dependent oxidoreductase [Candidatus Acetothermia bacterium]|nr:FAD-dependent oxidoreductase [Candidatus Acetothermia bacterium]MBI3642919.1 FAD-dependent oxidoreductase [Candidatus Acetothermia bacterium]